MVADALSRQFINSLDPEPESDAATIHSEKSLTYTVETVSKPVNVYRNQLILESGQHPSKRTFVIFGNKLRHFLTFPDSETLFKMLLEVVKSDVVNGIHCDLPLLAQIQHWLVNTFPNTTFRHTNKFVTDIFDPNEQMEIIAQEHNRAHRASQENVKQILNDYFFPRMEKKLGK